MLETMRKASKGWLAGILILLLVASFGIWGVQDMLNLSSTPTLATVGGEEITSDELQREFNRFLRQMTRDSKVELSSAQAKALGLDRQALDRMLTRKALLQKAKDLGLNVSQAQVVDSLKAIPGLSDGAGGINTQALQQILQNNELGQDEFLDLVHGDMLREQLMRTLLAGVTLPPGLNAALNRFRLERRTAEYVLVDPARAGEIKDPDDATLRKYYTEHAGDKYSTPELRAVTVVSARAADVSSEVQVTNEEIKRVYENNKRLYETPEKRTLEQIRFKSEAKAREAKTKLDAGQSFEAVAQAEGFKPEDIRLGEVSKSDTTIPAIAFQLPLSTVSEPVKGPFGWVILRALASTPGTLKTLDEVKPEIRDKLAEGPIKDKLLERTEAFEDARGGGATLEEAAKKHMLPILKIAAIDTRGNDANGQPIEGLPGGEFLRQVFSAESGVDSELGETPDGVYFEFRVDKISPVAKKPFEQVKADVLADWRAEELDRRLKKIADDLLKRGNGGESMASIASSLGVAPLRSDPLPRYGETEIFGSDTVAALADVKAGKFFSGPVAHGKSLVVARLADIQYAPEPLDAPTRTAYSQRLREAFASDLAEQFSNTVRDEVGVTIDEERFKTFHAGE